LGSRNRRKRNGDIFRSSGHQFLQVGGVRSPFGLGSHLMRAAGPNCCGREHVPGHQQENRCGRRVNRSSWVTEDDHWRPSRHEILHFARATRIGRDRAPITSNPSGGQQQGDGVRSSCSSQGLGLVAQGSMHGRFRARGSAASLEIAQKLFDTVRTRRNIGYDQFRATPTSRRAPVTASDRARGR
jgi:hypothetical protein